MASKDVGSSTSFYADDAVFLAPNAPPASDREAIRSAWSDFLRTPNLSLSFEPTRIEVSGAGDVAYDIGTYKLGMDGPGGRIDMFSSNRPLPSAKP